MPSTIAMQRIGNDPGAWNLFFQAQIGIRFILAVFPIMLIFSAQILLKWNQFSRKRRFIFMFLGIYLVASVASYYPHYLSYFNELILDRRQAYKVLADSNLDWGQNKAAINEFLQQHPEYIFEPSEPTTGLIIVGINSLTGVLGGPESFAWLRDNFEPIGHLYYTYLIFDISYADLEAIEAREIHQ